MKQLVLSLLAAACMGWVGLGCGGTPGVEYKNTSDRSWICQSCSGKVAYSDFYGDGGFREGVYSDRPGSVHASCPECGEKDASFKLGQ